MRSITARGLDAWTGMYGPTWRQGILSDHVHLAIEGGATERRSASGRRFYVTQDGRTEPVLCSELVEVWTEDGCTGGRCGRYATDGVTCDGHRRR